MGRTPKADVSAQGILDRFVLDKQTIDQIKNIIKAIDHNKIESIIDLVDGLKKGTYQIQININIQEK